MKERAGEPVSGLFIETYIDQATSWTMACKQTLAALNWVKVFHLARERFLAIKDAWMVEAMWCDGLSARSSPELQVEKITKLHRGKYRFLMRMAAIFSLSTIHWLLYASWLGVSCIGFRHKLLGLSPRAFPDFRHRAARFSPQLQILATGADFSHRFQISATDSFSHCWPAEISATCPDFHHKPPSSANH